MQQTVAYISFNGQCVDAFQFYAETLGGSVESVLLFSDCTRQEHFPMAQAKQVRHAVLQLEGLTLLGCDSPPAPIRASGHRHALSIDFRCGQRGMTAFMALAKDGLVITSFQSMGAAKGVGTVIDQFGILWTVSKSTTPIAEVENIQWSV